MSINLALCVAHVEESYCLCSIKIDLLLNRENDSQKKSTLKSGHVMHTLSQSEEAETSSPSKNKEKDAAEL